MPNHTFLWHDYETFGADPRRDRPAQFAALRTDAELNEIGAPLMLYCQPAPDFLPDPQSCLITGITPQHCLQHGVPEHQFAAAIESELATPGTIGVGYNTIRFDDEITRFMLWRNLIDPYAREWQNQCGRWDILDVVRAAYALRPDGIEWPQYDDGQPSFRLEHLTAANGIGHSAAHDALSDVRATIALARLLKDRQPKLFEFCFALHKKDRVAAEIGLPHKRPFLHVSGMFGTDYGCLAVMWPLALHPSNKNEVIGWNLAHDPAELIGLDLEQARLRLFSRSDALPPGVTRLPLKNIHLNRSPIVIGNLNTLSPQQAARWQIDLPRVQLHAQRAAELPDLSALWHGLFQRPAQSGVDVDHDLYGGFVGNEDRRQLERLRHLSGAALARESIGFDDARLEELVFRYRARNFPETLSVDDTQRWRQHRIARLIDGDGGRSVTQLEQEIVALLPSLDTRGIALLEQLRAYAELINPTI